MTETMTNESVKVTQADFEAIMDRLEKSPMNLTGKRWRDTPDDPALVELREHFILPIIDEYVRRYRTAAQPEREAVLEQLRAEFQMWLDRGPDEQPHYPSGMRPFSTGDLKAFVAALTTPAPAVSRDETNLAAELERLLNKRADRSVPGARVHDALTHFVEKHRAAILSRIRGEGE